MQKHTAAFSIPQPVEPKYDYTLHHPCGNNVVYSIYENNKRVLVQPDVDFGNGYLKFRFLRLPLSHGDYVVTIIG